MGHEWNPGPHGHPKGALRNALKHTADRLASGVGFRWTHMGRCNCGHLAQTVTALSPRELHEMALMRAGDWGEQVVDHCPASGLPFDAVLDALFALGLSPRDLYHLERLSDPAILRELPQDRRHLDQRDRDDAVTYLRAWAHRLDRELARASA